IVRAVGGGARADAFVSVLSVPTTVALSAPAAAHAAAPSSEEIRAKGTDALRDAASSMVAALKAKDVSLATQLFGDASDGDAMELVKTMKDQFGFAVNVVQVNQPQ